MNTYLDNTEDIELPLGRRNATIMRRNRLKKGEPMTICIAAIANNRTIFSAFDKMITSGDFQYEPPYTKGANIKLNIVHDSVAILTSGSPSIHAQIFQDLFLKLQNVPPQTTPRLLRVSEIAYNYVECYDNIRAKEIQSSVYAPLGLTNKTFLSEQKGMAADFLDKIKDEVYNYAMPRTTAIVFGIDDLGPHLYVLDNSTSLTDMTCRCVDSIGFAAIGSGNRHAETVFMATKHDRFSETDFTGFLTYRAKRHSEIASGVGKETDMYMIDEPTPGKFAAGWVTPDILSRFSDLYELRKRNEAAVSDTERQTLRVIMKELMAEHAAKSPSVPQQPSAQSPDAGPATSS
jgi:hypothetical protein